MLTVADGGGGGLNLADVGKLTQILNYISKNVSYNPGV
jgi:hypothetical protein